MKEMTTRERFTCMFEHRDADRVPIFDNPWAATIERWQREGMPKKTDFVDFFGLDHVVYIYLDSSPRYPEKVLEETEEYTIHTTRWGATLKDWKHAASTPQCLAYTITDRAAWEKAKKRMTPDRDRINWDYLRKNYPIWREKGSWINTHFWFGFDLTHARIVGTERLLIALAEDSEWCVDIFNHCLDMEIALFQMVWDAGYHFDAVYWPDDMGYKQHQFFSIRAYREWLKPVHQRAIEWAHSKGAKAHLHSCGDVRPFVPELVGMGLDALNPLEVKAGMDPVALKKQFGDRLLLHGGINAVLWDKPDEIEAEMRRTVPVLKQNGGYIFSSDHSVPSSVSLEDFRRIINMAKTLGAY